MNLQDLLDWMEDELENGNRVKASKLYKIFCNHARLQFPNATEHQLRNYKKYYWN